MSKKEVNKIISKAKEEISKICSVACSKLESLDSKKEVFMPVPEGIKIWTYFRTFALIINNGRTLFKIYNGLIELANHSKGNNWEDMNDDVQLMKVEYSDLECGDLVLACNFKNDYNNESCYYIIDENGKANYKGDNIIANIDIEQYEELWKVVAK